MEDGLILGNENDEAVLTRAEMDRDVWAIAWSSTEEYIVTSNRDGNLQEWGNIFESSSIYAQYMAEPDPATLEYSPDDRFIASMNNQSTRLWDALNLHPIWEYKGCCNLAAFYPSMTKLVFS